MEGSHRAMVDAMLWWLLRTGAPWRDLPERYGPWKSVYDRFNRWSKDGTFERIIERVCKSASTTTTKKTRSSGISLVRGRHHQCESQPGRGGSEQKGGPQRAEPQDHTLGRSRG